MNIKLKKWKNLPYSKSIWPDQENKQTFRLRFLESKLFTVLLNRQAKINDKILFHSNFFKSKFSSLAELRFGMVVNCCQKKKKKTLIDAKIKQKKQKNGTLALELINFLNLIHCLQEALQSINLTEIFN